MGYDLKCKFFYVDKDNNPIIVSKGYINDLKALNELKYSSTLEGVDECIDKLNLPSKNEIYGYFENEYVCTLPIIKFTCNGYLYDTKGYCEMFGEKYNRFNKSGYTFKDNSKLYQMKECIEEICDNSDLNGIDVYKVTYKEEKGELYDIDCFIKASKDFNSKIEEYRKTIFSLENLMNNNIEFYKLTSEQKDEMNETLSNAKGYKEMFENMNNSCTKMIHLLNYFQNDMVINDSSWRDEKMYVYVSVS